MSTVSKPNTFTAGNTIVASEHNSNFDTIYDDYNGNITNVNIKANAAIVDTKLAQISTASKVAGDALTSLANIPAGAGNIPSANMSTNAVVLTGSQTIYDVKTFNEFPLLPNSPTADHQAASKGYSDLNSLSAIEDYGTSASASTSRSQSALIICYGTIASIAGDSSQAITNLPFTSTNYTVTVSATGDNSDDLVMKIHTKSSGGFSIRNAGGAAGGCEWQAIGI